MNLQDLVTIGVGGGGIGVVGKSLFDFLRHRGDTATAEAQRREQQLWVEIGKLQGKVEALEKRLDSITADNIRLMLENAALKSEVDDLLEGMGKPIKYHTPTAQTHPQNPT